MLPKDRIGEKTFQPFCFFGIGRHDGQPDMPAWIGRAASSSHWDMPRAVPLASKRDRVREETLESGLVLVLKRRTADRHHQRDCRVDLLIEARFG